jgi:hypothetical protein
MCSFNNNPFPEELQTIVNTYGAYRNRRQLIVSVNNYNAERRRRRAILRQAGREMATLRSILPALPDNTFRANDPFAKISRNLKRDYNLLSPKRPRKSLRKNRKQRRKTRRHK